MFRSESMRQFELVLVVGIVCAGFLLARKRYVEALWILYFAHSALTSARHIPLYLIVASPIIAMEATSWWNIFFATLQKLDSQYPGCALCRCCGRVSPDNVLVSSRMVPAWRLRPLSTGHPTLPKRSPSRSSRRTRSASWARVCSPRSMGRLHPVQALAPAESLCRWSERLLWRKNRQRISVVDGSRLPTGPKSRRNTALT